MVFRDRSSFYSRRRRRSRRSRSAETVALSGLDRRHCRHTLLPMLISPSLPSAIRGYRYILATGRCPNAPPGPRSHPTAQSSVFLAVRHRYLPPPTCNSLNNPPVSPDPAATAIHQRIDGRLFDSPPTSRNSDIVNSSACNPLFRQPVSRDDQAGLSPTT